MDSHDDCECEAPDREWFWFMVAIMVIGVSAMLSNRVESAIKAKVTIACYEAAKVNTSLQCPK